MDTNDQPVATRISQSASSFHLLIAPLAAVSKGTFPHRGRSRLQTIANERRENSKGKALLYAGLVAKLNLKLARSSRSASR